MGFGGGGSDPAPVVVDETKTTAEPAAPTEDKGRPGTRQVNRYATRDRGGALMAEEDGGSETGGDDPIAGKKKITPQRSSTASMIG